MLSFLWSLLVDLFRKPKPVHFHTSGMQKSAFQLRVEHQMNQCCLCGGSGHNSNNCPWSKE